MCCMNLHLSLLNSKGASKLANKALEEGKWRRQFISNQSKIMSFLDGIDLQKAHIDCLKKGRMSIYY